MTLIHSILLNSAAKLLRKSGRNIWKSLLQSLPYFLISIWIHASPTCKFYFLFPLSDMLYKEWKIWLVYWNCRWSRKYGPVVIVWKQWWLLRTTCQGRLSASLKCWYRLRCRFSIVTSDGSLQRIEISHGQSGSTFPKYISNHTSLICNNIFCFDCHGELNLFVAVHKNSGMHVFGYFLNYFLLIQVLVLNLSRALFYNRQIYVCSLRIWL